MAVQLPIWKALDDDASRRDGSTRFDVWTAMTKAERKHFSDEVVQRLATGARDERWAQLLARDDSEASLEALAALTTTGGAVAAEAATALIKRGHPNEAMPALRQLLSMNHESGVMAAAPALLALGPAKAVPMLLGAASPTHEGLGLIMQTVHRLLGVSEWERAPTGVLTHMRLAASSRFPSVRARGLDDWKHVIQRLSAGESPGALGLPVEAAPPSDAMRTVIRWSMGGGNVPIEALARLTAPEHNQAAMMIIRGMERSVVTVQSGRQARERLTPSPMVDRWMAAAILDAGNQGEQADT